MWSVGRSKLFLLSLRYVIMSKKDSRCGAVWCGTTVRSQRKQNKNENEKKPASQDQDKSRTG